MKCFFLPLFILLCITVNAQKSPEYLWGRNGGNHDIAADLNGDVWAIGKFEDTVLIGNTWLTPTGEGDLSIVKTDRNGNYIWVQQYSNTSKVLPIKIACDAGGNAYFTCRYWDTVSFGNTTIISRGEDDVALVKLDTYGDVMWVKTFGGTNEDWGLNNLALDKAGNIYMSLMSKLYFQDTTAIGQYLFVDSFRDEDIFIIKANNNGDVLWVNREGSKFQDRTFGIATDVDGNIYNTGWFADTAYFGGQPYIAGSGFSATKMYISKYNSTGNLQFVKTPISNGGTGLDIAVSNDGSIYIGAQSYSPKIIFSNDSFALDSGSAFLAKFDKNGEPLWADNSGLAGGHSALNIALDNNGDIYTTLVYTGQATLAKYSKTGMPIWNNLGTHSSPALRIEGLCSSINNDIFITGTYSDLNKKIGNDVLPVIPGNLFNAFIARVDAYPTGLVDTLAHKNIPFIYPNPNNGNFTIKDLPAGEHSYEIINAVGQVVYKGEVDKVNLTGLPQGFYMLRLDKSDNAVMKFIVE